MNKKTLSIICLLFLILSTTMAGMGVNKHKDAKLELQVYTSQVENYYGKNSKAQRDSAPADSELAIQLGQIESTSKNIDSLHMLGIGKILGGIFTLQLGMFAYLWFRTSLKEGANKSSITLSAIIEKKKPGSKSKAKK